MADTQSFTFNLGLGVVPELDAKKYPEVYTECARLRQALRSVASALDTDTASTTAAIETLKESSMNFKRVVNDTISISAGLSVATYTISPSLASITNKVMLIPLGVAPGATSPTLADTSVRLQLTDVSTITAYRSSLAAQAVSVGFQLIEFQ